MASSINIDGTYRPVGKIHCNIDGTWRQIKKGFVNIGGTWKEFYSGTTEMVLVNKQTFFERLDPLTFVVIENIVNHPQISGYIGGGVNKFFSVENNTTVNERDIETFIITRTTNISTLYKDKEKSCGITSSENFVYIPSYRKASSSNPNGWWPMLSVLNMSTLAVFWWSGFGDSYDNGAYNMFYSNGRVFVWDRPSYYMSEVLALSYYTENMERTSKLQTALHLGRSSGDATNTYIYENLRESNPSRTYLIAHDVKTLSKIKTMLTDTIQPIICIKEHN